MVSTSLFTSLIVFSSSFSVSSFFFCCYCAFSKFNISFANCFYSKFAFDDNCLSTSNCCDS